MNEGASGGNPARGALRAPPGLHPLGLVALYAGIGLLPLILAAAQGRPAGNFWRELSSGLVMVGFALLLVQFLLSGRFRQVSGKVGIDLTMRFHQIAAWMVLAFILVHPFLYAAPRLAMGVGDALFSLNRMFSSPGLRTGVIAWWLMILLIPLAVWRDRLPVPYELWRLSHGLGSAAIAALSAHHTLRVGTYSSDPLLAGVWIALTALALVSLAFVYIVKPVLQMRARYRVVSNRKVADRMWEVAVEPEHGRAMDFDAGQFAWLNLGHSPFSLTEHPFSVSSAPQQRPRIAFTIKESGDFTNQIGEIAEGTRAYLDGPHGNFSLAGRGTGPVVLIAGGVGFAPVMGLMRDLAARQYTDPVHLIYGNRVESQILYRHEIEKMQADLGWTVDLVLSEPSEEWKGRIGELTPDVLRVCLAEADLSALYFVCGPTAMMDSVENALVAMGVPGGRIVSERFKYD
jgi:predicted ferric reductase